MTDVPSGSDELPAVSAPVRYAGRYVLMGVLGSGGMATVHRAHDEVLDREVALKVLHPHLAHDPAFRERFLREGRAAAALSHPNVVAIHDLAADDERAFLVLELVDGPTLQDVLRTRGRLAPGEALSLLGPAAAGLAAAHAKGLVHRDVKPANILITGGGVPKIGDFGLARAAAAAAHTFGSDVLVGSPHYLPPEAVDGQALEPAGDVYSLGVVLFEALTGRPPYEGDTPMATALQHTTGTIPAPSSLVAGLPVSIDEVVRRATRLDPADRYPDAEAFARDLAASTPGGPAPLDLRDGQHHTMVMPRTGLDAVDDEATHVVLRTDDGGDEEQSHRLSRRQVLGWILAALALLGTAGFAVWSLLISPTLDVPDVVGLPSSDAAGELEDAGFVAALADQGEHDLDVPAGAVLRQDPAGRARKGTTVTLVLSLGPAEVTVPDVTGMQQSDAVATLREAGFATTTEFEFHPDVAEGDVIATDPSGGAIALDGSEVVVTVSRGREPVEVPVVVGLDEQEALAQLEAAGLIGEVGETRFDEEVPEGHVIDQIPAGRVDVFKGDTVSLIVSKGPRPFELPDVRGQQEEDARRVLEGLGLVVEVERTRTVFGFRDGRVESTDPSPGTEVRRGDTVVLFVYDSGDGGD